MLINTKKTRCRICDNEKDNQPYEAQEMMFGYKDVFQYFQCSKCKCLQIAEYPPNMAKYYPDHYYSFQPVSHQNEIIEFLTRLRNNYAICGQGLIGKLLYARYPIESLRYFSLLPLTKNSKILDVGCGEGELLYRLSKIGFTNLLGIDPFNSQDIKYEIGLKIFKKEIYGVCDEWDLIMFHHSFEHIPDQAKMMQMVSRLLKPDGYCILRVPTVTSHAWENYRTKWVQLDAPRHFYLHSVESMKILADKNGFNLYKIIYDSNSFQFWGSEQYLSNITLYDKRSYAIDQHNSIFSKKEIAFFAKRAAELNKRNQGDQAIFFLRKSLKNRRN